MSRRLRDALEPLAANVYFAPEAISGYEALGLDYGAGYFASRGACMGQVPGEVIAAAFGVFYPPMVVQFVDDAWSKTTAAEVLVAREKGAVAAVERMLLSGSDDADAVASEADVERATELLRRMADAGQVAGHPLYAGLRSLGWPGSTLGDLWRAADLVREHRGDSHVGAWVQHGLSALEVMLLSEPWWGLPLNSALRTRGWPKEEVFATMDSLRDRGLLDGDGLSDAGRDLRESVEAMTDRSDARLLDALGDDAEELLGLLEPWAAAIYAAGGMPQVPRTPR